MTNNLLEEKLNEIESRLSQLISECKTLQEECKELRGMLQSTPDLRNLREELSVHDRHKCVTRTTNALTYLDIHTVQDLIDSGLTIKELSKQRNMGKPTAQRFAELVKEHIGYEMK